MNNKQCNAKSNHAKLISRYVVGEINFETAEGSLMNKST